jgi:hypothetical protein
VPEIGEDGWWVRYFKNNYGWRIEPPIPGTGKTLRLGAGAAYATTDAAKITALVALPSVAEIDAAAYNALAAPYRLPYAGEPEPGDSDFVTEAEVDNERGVFKMLQGWVPQAWWWIVVTQQIQGWDAPQFTTLDGIGSYTAYPFGAYAALGAIPFDTWFQNTTGAPFLLNLPAAIVAAEKNQDGHIYLVVSADKATNFRADALGLRNGAALS